ncbi:MAG: hypothetical protein N3G79_02090 [Sulfolobales archaeon]|nr:hypothetical protein [Sulfolobales archaeon]
MKRVSFRNALSVLEGRIAQFDDLRSRSMRELPKSRTAAFDALYELLNKVAATVRSLSALEASVGLELGYRKVCGESILIKTRSSSTFIKFKPLRIVSYSASDDSVKISYGGLSIEVAGDSIAVSLGKSTQILRYANPGEIASSAAIYSLTLSKVMSVPDELSRTISSCAKAIGVRL